jgi:UPF0716 family protein affecting phage T7 exclusion
MWTLIVTVFVAGQGLSLTHVDGFNTQQTCQSAGMTVQRDIHRNKEYSKVFYQCVKK